MKKNDLIYKETILILKELRPYYPEINFSKIKISIVKKTDFFAAIHYKLTTSGILSTLVIDRSLLKMSKKSIKGCIAHELSHIVLDKNIFTWINNSERTTDIDVLKRGLGNELYSFVKEHNKKRKKYNKKDGLTKKEIKKYIKTGNLPLK